MNNTVFYTLSILLLTFVFAPHANAYAENAGCSSHPIGDFSPPPESGRLVLHPYPDDNPNDDVEAAPFPQHTAIIASPATTFDEQISPNGQYFSFTRREEGISTTLVYNSDFQIIFEGASRTLEGNSHWLGNEIVIALVARRRAYDVTVEIYYIDPFAREYRHFIPNDQHPFLVNRGRDTSIFYSTISYDGRYYCSFFGCGYGYDFQTNSIFNVNAPGGLQILSSSSDRLITSAYDTSKYNGGQRAEATADTDIWVYNFATDTQTQVGSLAIESPLDIYANQNGWSPDERMWALALDYGDEIMFQRLLLLDLESGQHTPLCLGRYYSIEYAPAFDAQGNVIPNLDVPFVYGVSSPDFTWSRDSRYLALQGVLEGEDIDESLGVYIYDTQTGDIYQAYQGRADIIGWMASPDTE